jgi:hypothetical protein
LRIFPNRSRFFVAHDDDLKVNVCAGAPEHRRAAVAALSGSEKSATALYQIPETLTC